MYLLLMYDRCVVSVQPMWDIVSPHCVLIGGLPFPWVQIPLPDRSLEQTYEHAAGGAAKGDMNLWDCLPTNLPESKLAPRTEAKLPPPSWQWYARGVERAGIVDTLY